jgi:hypothetical protein
MQEFKKEYRLAVRLFADAFAADATLMYANRYNAACAACLAAAGQGKDADNLSDEERADLRRQALAWLGDDVQAGAQSLRSTPPSAVSLAENLKHWKIDPDLLSVRDPKELAKLPEAEQPAWRKLWSNVNQLLKEANAAFTETVLKGTLTANLREQAHEMKMSAGTTYGLHMTSADFVTYLRVETAQKEVLAVPDNIFTNARDSVLTFTPKEDGVYRIIASSSVLRGGTYTLTIREFHRRKE